jgi:hypothetical protein
MIDACRRTSRGRARLGQHISGNFNSISELRVTAKQCITVFPVQNAIIERDFSKSAPFFAVLLPRILNHISHLNSLGHGLIVPQ